MKFFALFLLLLTPHFAIASDLYEWNGIALGADSSIKIYAENEQQAKAAFDESFTEIERLENILSLYKPNSEISLLNEHGFLKSPSKELVELLRYAKNLAFKTNGVFDPSIQVLWNRNPDQSLINYHGIIIDERIIYFRKKGMAVTLNAIAQGYITDKIVEVLRKKNIRNALVDLGEKYALGTHPAGKKWKIAAGNKIYELENQAISTSSNSGGEYVQADHIIDAKTGAVSSKKAITIIADSALEADANSTLEVLLRTN